VELILTGVDLDRFAASGADRENARKAFGIGADDLVVGTVGKLAPGKHVDLLVDAFATIPAGRMPGECRLLLVGPDLGSLGMLQERAAALGVADRVVFVPGMSDVRPAYAAMDVFAMTSLGEGLPNVILEAMAMGLPIVTTGAGSIPEAMDGNGFLLPGADAMRIGRRMARLLRDARLRRRMGERSLAIAARFAMRHSVGRYEEMFVECLAAATDPRPSPSVPRPGPKFEEDR
jgi:glycosyltransferase involved in cell wall biosynthesis